MSENEVVTEAVETAETAETEAPETEETAEETPVFEVPQHDWEKAVTDEDAPAKVSLLAPIMLLAKEAADIRTKYLSMTDIDSAVESYVESTDDKEIAQWRKEMEQARKLLAQREALIEEKARKAVTADIDPDFDEAKTKAQYNDLISAIKTAYNDGVRNIFKTLGHLTADVSPAGRETNWRPTSGYGQALLNAYRMPRLDKDSASGDTGKTDPQVTAWNKAAKAWGKDNGFTVKDKGALSLELKEAYQKHLDSQK